MHGLVNRAIQVFVRDTYGTPAWRKLIRSLDLGFEDFESMLTYDDAVTHQLVDRACIQFQRDRSDFLEDLGTFLVSHESVGALRRLLRFGGDSFLEFLNSLDEMPERIRLAVPDLVLPHIEVEFAEPGKFELTVNRGLDGFEHVMMGVLRAMADDYGALVLLECEQTQDGVARLWVSLLDLTFAEGRDFVLGAAS
ncbi:MAG: heme NO-binding domain-containing protein [Brevirhabdus sp.]